ncbi:zinc finger, CCHC-type containing protein [Tanacetum coccineum]
MTHNYVPFAPKPKTPPPPKKKLLKELALQGLRVESREADGNQDALSLLHVGDGHRAAVEAIGTYHLELPSGLVIVLNNCHYAPSITRGVISVSRLFDDGLLIRFDDKMLFQFQRDNLVYFMAVPRDGIFEIDMYFKRNVGNPTREGTIKSLRSDRGVSERRNRTLLDMVRSMMSQTTLPKSFWDYALESAARILNMVPTKKVDKTPYEISVGVWKILNNSRGRYKSFCRTLANIMEEEIKKLIELSDINPFVKAVNCVFNQSAYIGNLEKDFTGKFQALETIPMHEKLLIGKSQGASTPAEKQRMQNIPYASAIGSIMYAVRCTRSDVAFAQKHDSDFNRSGCCSIFAAFDASKEAIWIRATIFRQGTKAMFSKQAEQELLQTVREFHTCKQEEGQSVSSHVLKMKGYIDNLERLEFQYHGHGGRKGSDKPKNKPHKAGRGGKGKGKNKMGYAHNNVSFAPKPKTSPPTRRITQQKDAILYQCG